MRNPFIQFKVRGCLLGVLCMWSVWVLAQENTFAQNGALGEEWSGKEVVVALRPDKNPDAMLDERTALAEYLQKQLGKPTRVIIPLSAAVIAEGLRNGTIDAAYLSGTEMVTMEKSEAGELLLANAIQGSTGYESYWLVAKEDTARDITDLKGESVAFSSRTSTSGYLMPLRDLHARGLVSNATDVEQFFGEVFFGTGYVSAVERVLAGQARAAAVSDYVFQGEKHLTPEQKAKLRILQAQGPVPTHVVAVASGLKPQNREALRKAFLSLNAPENSSLRDRIFTAEFVEVNPADHLRPVREALHLLEVGS